MRHVMYKFFSIGAYEKEENWLNEMSAKGMQLVHASGIRFVFEEGPRSEYIYRIELLEHLPPHPESMAYLRFLEETGVEYISNFHRWVYLRKKSSEGPFEVYSDIDSKIRHYRRILAIANAVSIVLLFISTLYLTEAYKQYQGSAFWVSQGFQGTSYHIPFVIDGAMILAMSFFVQAIVIPIRKSIRELRRKKRISE